MKTKERKNDMSEFSLSLYPLQIIEYASRDKHAVTKQISSIDQCIQLLLANKRHSMHAKHIFFKSIPRRENLGFRYPMVPVRTTMMTLSHHSSVSSLVNVQIFHDSVKNVYRILSIDGSKILLNTIIIARMTFTKTSQKFCQWVDSRANQVYGLGFANENELTRVDLKIIDADLHNFYLVHGEILRSQRSNTKCSSK